MTGTNHPITVTPSLTWRPSFKNRLYDLTAPLGEAFHKLVYMPRFADWCRTQGGDAPVFPDRTDLYRHLVEVHGLGGVIDYLEFGVFRGESMRWWLAHNNDPAARFVGFDGFTGLPESWVGLPSGTFSAGGDIPQFDDPRVSLEIGLFQETLAGFLQRNPLDRRTVVHIDADLYSATLYVLTMLAGRFKSGDIIIFDELGSGYGVTHEFRALSDFQGAYGIHYRVLGGAQRYVRAAIEIL